MKIRAIELHRSQLGWVADVWFLVSTANQFTDEEHACRTDGKFLLTALWNGLRLAKAKARKLEAKPGERVAKGWPS